MDTSLIIIILLSVLGLVILYFIIESGVRNGVKNGVEDGIDNSIIGEYLRYQMEKSKDDISDQD